MQAVKDGIFGEVEMYDANKMEEHFSNGAEKVEVFPGNRENVEQAKKRTGKSYRSLVLGNRFTPAKKKRKKSN